MASIGERIKERRSELGMKQAALAKKVGLSQATISDLENNPAVKTREVARFAAVLGVSALWLADGIGPKTLDGTVQVLQHEIPPQVLHLAERLVLLPDDKLKAISILLGIKF